MSSTAAVLFSLVLAFFLLGCGGSTKPAKAPATWDLPIGAPY
jgi:hypothetical protein